MRTCTCPVGTYLTNLGTITCPESFGQTQKLVIQRAAAAGTGGYGIVSTVILAATWTALKAAVDSTKAIITPFLSGLTTEIGKAKEFGSGNEVRNGIPIIFGTDPTKVTVKLYEYPASVIRNLKLLACEANLEIGLINELGFLGCRVDGTIYKGFPIQSLFVSDKMLGGFDGPDYYELTFQMKPNWSDYFTIVDPSAQSWSFLDL
jgi:hypothetical protein